MFYIYTFRVFQIASGGMGVGEEWEILLEEI